MIQFTCVCGKLLQAREEHAGQITRCPACHREQAIPTVESEAPFVLPAEDREAEAAATSSEARELAPPTSRRAVASLVLGILGIAPCFFLTGIPAIVLGALGHRDISRSGGRLKGQGLALAGIILGAASLFTSLAAFLVILPALLLPAVQKVREAANRMQSMNNLNQLALALHNFHDDNQCLPPPVVYSADGKPLYSWRVLLLPYLGEQALLERFQLDEPWDSPNNRALLSQMPLVFADLELGSPTEGMTTYKGLVGKGMIFEHDPDAKLEQFMLKGFDKPFYRRGPKITFTDITDGTSNTLLLVQAEPPVEWTRPDDVQVRADQPFPALGLARRPHILVVFADGSARDLRTGINEATLRGLASRAGGEVVTLP